MLWGYVRYGLARWCRVQIFERLLGRSKTAMGRTRLLNVGLLISTIVFFAAWYRVDSNGRPTGPVTGNLLPDISLVEVTTAHHRTHRDFAGAAPGCVLVSFVSSRCSARMRRRATWASRARAWRDSVARPVRFAWVAAESPSALEGFVREFDFAGFTLLTFNPEESNPLSKLGVYGTPTTYLIDAEGRLRYGVLGPLLPALDVAASACG